LVDIELLLDGLLKKAESKFLQETKLGNCGAPTTVKTAGAAASPGEKAENTGPLAGNEQKAEFGIGTKAPAAGGFHERVMKSEPPPSLKST
jgi:hypothetical protein